MARVACVGDLDAEPLEYLRGAFADPLFSVPVEDADARNLPAQAGHLVLALGGEYWGWDTCAFGLTRREG